METEINVLQILLSGKCPHCGEVPGHFSWYVKPGEGQAGVFCDSCNTHFFDPGTCKQQFDTDYSHLESW